MNPLGDLQKTGSFEILVCLVCEPSLYFVICKRKIPRPMIKQELYEAFNCLNHVGLKSVGLELVLDLKFCLHLFCLL